MATKNCCDGCDATLEGAGERVGVVIPRDYCPACATVAREYIEKRDFMHASAARMWQVNALAVYNDFKARMPGGRLPDERG